MMKKTSIVMIVFFSSIAVIGMQWKKNDTATAEIPSQKNSKFKEIYFAGGCFWGVEKFFMLINGVKETSVGYANGNIPNPNYQKVSSDKTGFTETVKVVYDPNKLKLEQLVDFYFKIIDPTSLNKQGNDIGTRYRTGIYFTESSEKKIIDGILQKQALLYKKPIVVEVLPLKNYYIAEDYHQDYLTKNPNGYCHIDPKWYDWAKAINSQNQYKKADREELKKKLNTEQFNVTQNNATERPFQNSYWNEFREGIYVDITNGEPLFVSTDKFESDCGWPSFSKPINQELLIRKKDSTHGMNRVEIRSKNGDSHLGHVFTDGPKKSGGLRYCINSASLRFISKEDMKKEGYEAYLSLL